MTDDDSRSYRLTQLSSVQAQPITYLLPGRIPYGAITLLGGRPGQGKSQLALALAAGMTKVNVPVLLIGSEDGLADTVKPRLLAAGANTELVHEFGVTQGREDGVAVFPHDAPLLIDAIRQTGARLVVIDPIAGHLGEEINSNSDQSVRSAMLPLAKACQVTGAAAVVVLHPKKGRDGSPLDWFGGSVGFGGIARSALLFGTHRTPGESVDAFDLRYLVHVKGNGMRLAPTVECKIVGATVEDGGRSIETSRVHLDLSNLKPSVWAEDLA